MTWKTKAILNYITAIIWIVVGIIHIYTNNHIARIAVDFVCGLWFCIIATIYLRKQYKNQ